MARLMGTTFGKKWTLESFQKHALELRRLVSEAEHTLFAFCMEAEKLDFWCETGEAFEVLLEKLDIMKAIRYIQYKRAVEKTSLKAVRSVGVEAAMFMAQAKTPEEAREIRDQAETFERTNGTSISSQSAKKIAGEQRARFIGLRGGAQGYISLHDEVEQLRKENEKLRLENAALRAELKQLKRKPRRAPEARA